MAQDGSGNGAAQRRVFRCFLKSALVVNCVLLGFLTFGFLLPAKPMHDPKTGGLSVASYDDSAKISPFTPPAPEPAPARVEVPCITARGDHPTFVPAESADMDTRAQFSQANFDDSHDLRAVPVQTAAPSASVMPRVETVAAPHTT